MLNLYHSRKMETQKLYHSTPNELQTEATCLKCIQVGDVYHVVLDKTIFHPKGGGQKADAGTINDVIQVSEVLANRDSREILHLVTSPITEGTKVSLRVDPTVRRLNSQWHSAGHLLALIVANLYQVDLSQMKAHQYPDEGYVEFPSDLSKGDIDTEKLVQGCLKAINDSLTITYSQTEHGRFVEIDSLGSIPCGGTHVENTSEIGNLGIRKVKKKGGNIKISYFI